MTAPTDANPAASAAASPITKIGTEVFGLRVVSGYLHSADPDRIFLRQLYPGAPTNIGRIDTAGIDTGLSIHPGRAAEWTDHDRAALTAFFLTRHTDRMRSQR